MSAMGRNWTASLVDRMCVMVVWDCTTRKNDLRTLELRLTSFLDSGLRQETAADR